MKYTIEFQKTYGEKTIIVVAFGNDVRCIEKHPSLYYPNTTDYYCEHKSIRSVPNDVSFDAVVKGLFCCSTVFEEPDGRPVEWC